MEEEREGLENVCLAPPTPGSVVKKSCEKLILSDHGESDQIAPERTELGTFGDKALEGWGLPRRTHKPPSVTIETLFPQIVWVVWWTLWTQPLKLLKRQRQVDLYEFEAILFYVVRVLGHPVLHGETLSQTKLGLHGEVLSQTNQNRT